MALVSWGCVYRMTWVDVRPAVRWIRKHALNSSEAGVKQDGTYSHGKHIIYLFLIFSFLQHFAS